MAGLSVAEDSAEGWGSWAMGWADATYARLTTCARSWTFGMESRRKQMFFSSGWGDMRRYAQEEEALLETWASEGGAGFTIEPAAVEWTEVDHSGDVWSDEGRVQSPVAAKLQLPARVETLRFLFVRPRPAHAGGSALLPPLRAVVVQTAATGATEYEPRLSTLAVPLLEHGVGSVLLMPAWYGSRAPSTQSGCYVETVADYLRQTLAVVTEGGALLRWLRTGFTVDPAAGGDGPEAYTAGELQVGCTGFSWGGAMAACCAVVSQERVACVPCCGSVSPDVMVIGFMRWQHSWQTLQDTLHTAFDGTPGEGYEVASAKQQGDRGHAATCSYEETSERLLEIFRSVTLQKIVSRRGCDRRRTIGSVVQLQAKSDGYIPKDQGYLLHRVLATATEPSALLELRWTDGGHVVSFLRLGSDAVPAIVHAVDALDLDLKSESDGSTRKGLGRRRP